LALTSSAVANQKGPNCYPLQDGDCPAKVDISIVLDGSGSVTEAKFREILNVLADGFFSRFEISQTMTRVQLVVYDGSASVVYRLTAHDDLGSLQAATKAAAYPGGGTLTGNAMKVAREQFIVDMRPDVIKFCLVMTDGASSDSAFEEGEKWAAIAKVTGIAMGTEVTPYQTCQATKIDTDFPGNDIGTPITGVIDMDACQMECEKTSLCRGVVYIPTAQQCQLKSDMPDGAETFAPGFNSAKCAPGVSEVTMGDRGGVLVLEEIDQLSTLIDTLVQETCPGEKPFNCEKCRCKALSYWVFDDKYFVPECNSTDNTHMPKQCNQGFCFCVDKHGKEIADTRVPETTELDCNEISAAASMQDKVCPKKVETEFFKASCKQNGDFEAIQCMKGPASTRMCWCALPNGLMIPKTVYSPLTGPIPDCKRHINLAYDCEGREGTFPHPFDLNRYISCKEGGAYACACQPGLVYNPSKRVCAYTSKPDA